MKSSKVLGSVVVAALLSLVAWWAQAQQPRNNMSNRPMNQSMGNRPMNCQDEMNRRQQAQSQLNGCIGGWLRPFGPDEPDPPDDCSKRLAHFVQTARSAKKCNAQMARGMNHR